MKQDSHTSCLALFRCKEFAGRNSGRDGISGINRNELSAMADPSRRCRLVNPKLPSGDLAAASDPVIRMAFRERFQNLLASATGSSSTRSTCAVLLDTPLSINRGEVTNKGSVNQRALLEQGVGVIEKIYSPLIALN